MAMTDFDSYIIQGEPGKKEKAYQLRSKSQNGTLNYTLTEMALLRFVKDNPYATQADIARHIGKSERTAKRMTPSLAECGMPAGENVRSSLLFPFCSLSCGVCWLWLFAQ